MWMFPTCSSKIYQCICGIYHSKYNEYYKQSGKGNYCGTVCVGLLMMPTAN